MSIMAHLYTLNISDARETPKPAISWGIPFVRGVPSRSGQRRFTYRQGPIPFDHVLLGEREVGSGWIVVHASRTSNKKHGSILRASFDISRSNRPMLKQEQSHEEASQALVLIRNAWQVTTTTYWDEPCWGRKTFRSFKFPLEPGAACYHCGSELLEDGSHPDHGDTPFWESNLVAPDYQEDLEPDLAPFNGACCVCHVDNSGTLSDHLLRLDPDSSVRLQITPRSDTPEFRLSWPRFKDSFRLVVETCENWDEIPMPEYRKHILEPA